MIVDLTTIKIGQAIRFRYEAPLRGLVNMTTFTDVITGTTGTRFFTKEFRYSVQGARFTDYEELTAPNLVAVGTLPLKNDFIIEFRYVRSGTDNTGNLTIDELTIIGNFSLAYLQVLDFENTVFEDISFTDIFWNQAWINLFEKLYVQGIIPRFIERGDESNQIDEEDFVVLWKANAYYFALLLALVDFVVTKMFQNEKLMTEYLLQRGLFVCGDEDITVLQQLSEEIYDEVRQRATTGMIRQDGDHITPVIAPLHGELLRLICFDIVCDEFLFEFLSSEFAGWTVNNTSPLFRGQTLHKQLNKTPENTADFVDISLYTITGSSVIATDGGREVINMIGAGTLEPKNSIKVDDSLSYEITFEVRDIGQAGTLDFKVFTEDKLGTPIDLLDIETAVVKTEFFSSIAMLQSGKYYFVRGIIFAVGAPALSGQDAILNIGVGKHLQFSVGAQRLFITIENTSGGVDEINIHNFKMKPLTNDYITGASVNGQDTTNIWMRNRNKNFSSISLENDIRDKLLPAGSVLNINELP